MTDVSSFYKQITLYTANGTSSYTAIQDASGIIPLLCDDNITITWTDVAVTTFFNNCQIYDKTTTVTVKPTDKSQTASTTSTTIQYVTVGWMNSFTMGVNAYSKVAGAQSIVSDLDVLADYPSKMYLFITEACLIQDPTNQYNSSTLVVPILLGSISWTLGAISVAYVVTVNATDYTFYEVPITDIIFTEADYFYFSNETFLDFAVVCSSSSTAIVPIADYLLPSYSLFFKFNNQLLTNT